ncbi:bacillithiol system redox-active protein YtxJ [Flavobacterium sp. ASW18X]|uniref:bacillithiol system redox-active protein YtxJ n=1 Tax=Flavobacterium sp. ASW18X TaxID=2572595 RepID=UPI0010ADCA12|nr:bacillithiol system redox-active protein YtxJ [Flavobacterium sp. ASW18X]TKD65867.1 bacillithiol system redox-active protein YtxJ [Flavobacterium sp. ASW18X]
MGLFNKIFGGSTDESNASGISWIPLENEDQLNIITEQSKLRTQVLFKHSTTCGISRMVLNMFTSNFDVPEGEMDMYFLDLHAYRNVSNKIAEVFQVVHQSPQLIIVKDGKVVFHTSHGAISDVDLKQY